MMDNCYAPQWADFTCSPQLPSDSYFEIEHEVHESQIHLKTVQSTFVSCKKENIKDPLDTATNFDDSLETEEKPTNVAYFIAHDKKQSMKVINNANVSNTAKTSKLDEKSCKNGQAWDVPVHELTCAFKSLTAANKPKPLLTEKTRKSTRTSEAKSVIFGKPLRINKVTNQIKEEDDAQIASIINESIVNSDISHCSEYTKNSGAKKRLSFKVSHSQRRRSFKLNRYSLGKSQPTVLTCQYRGQGLMKYRRCSNRFVSLAEAVSKFQNTTPQRFRTTKGPLMKLKRAPFKLTYPVSPALRCKQRTRRTTVLSQQDREALELEEMKKHQIKANPVPVNILKAPTALKKVPKKPITVTEEFRLTQPMKTRHTTGSQLNSQHVDGKEQNHKSAAPITRSVSTSNVTTKKDGNIRAESSSDSNEKSEASTLPSRFEMRNKEFQMKKVEKLKSLQVQETNKIKAEFHARPAPKFSKPSNPVKEQNMKKRVVPCPFSFEKRDLAKKKEALVKQKQEKDDKPRIFHANPAPTFKPVTIHGLSKENLRSKEKSISSSKEFVARQTKSCNNQENKQPNIIAPATACTTKETTQNIINNEPDKKRSQNIIDATDSKNEKAKTNANKITVPKFELRSYKRAKERNEFDEKIRKKEQDLEAKRQEEEKNKSMREKLERAELRKMAEVKARPMPVYKPLVIVKSTKPPTSPQSPGWANKAKSKRVP